MVQKVGEGAYGEVFKARRKRNDELVAVKIIRVNCSVQADNGVSLRSSRLHCDWICQECVQKRRLTRVHRPTALARLDSRDQVSHAGTAALWPP